MNNQHVIPTNDVFHHLLLLMQIHNDKKLILDIFASAGVEVSNSKVQSWRRKTGAYSRHFQAMPRDALEKFIGELHERRLIEVD